MPKRTKPPEPAITAPGGFVKPMPHADSPTLAADSGEFSWRCDVDGQRNSGPRCTTCGTVKK